VILEETGLKQFVTRLSSETGINLKSRKEFIKKCLMAAIEKQKESEVEEDASEDEEDSEDDEDAAPTVKKSRGGGGLKAQKQVSPALAKFLGQGDTMARTAIVKALWDYIRQHNLQNPQNKREILLDEAMQHVFGCKSFTMFTMNKYISAHVHPFTPVDLTTNATPKRTPSKKRKTAGHGSTEKKKRKAGSQPPYRLSESLQAVVGADILPRPQVVSKIWEYIKARDLQNPSDKRQIICDDVLKKVMGGKSTVTMFNMNQFITHHLIEKLDKSMYQQPESGKDSDSDDE